MEQRRGKLVKRARPSSLRIKASHKLIVMYRHYLLAKHYEKWSRPDLAAENMRSARDLAITCLGEHAVVTEFLRAESRRSRELELEDERAQEG